jgi:hypothetical protein
LPAKAEQVGRRSLEAIDIDLEELQMHERTPSQAETLQRDFELALKTTIEPLNCEVQRSKMMRGILIPFTVKLNGGNLLIRVDCDLREAAIDLRVEEAYGTDEVTGLPKWRLARGNEKELRDSIVSLKGSFPRAPKMRVGQKYLTPAEHETVFRERFMWTLAVLKNLIFKLNESE